jgi:hypothetical protein
MILSAHPTDDTNRSGLPNFASQVAKSASVTHGHGNMALKKRRGCVWQALSRESPTRADNRREKLIRRRLAHQIGRFAGEEDSHFVPGVGQYEPVDEWEWRARRVIRTPF